MRIADLSSGGAFLEMDAPPAPGRHLGLGIPLPDGEIQIVSFVRWVRAAASAGPPALPAGAGVSSSRRRQPRPPRCARRWMWD